MLVFIVSFYHAALSYIVIHRACFDEIKIIIIIITSVSETSAIQYSSIRDLRKYGTPCIIRRIYIFLDLPGHS